MSDSRPVPEHKIPKPHVGFWFTIKPFFIGGLSGCIATACIQPLDTIKVRIQCINEENAKNKIVSKQKPNMYNVGTQVFKNEGIRGLYQGLDAGLLRQVMYTTVRLGLYRYISDEHKRITKRTLTMFEKMAISLTSGWIGSIIGNPAEVALVRFQADTLLPVDQRRNYKHVFDALRRVVKEEGLFTLWRGSFPTIVRAGFMNMGLIAPYEEIKERINAWTGTVDRLSTRLFAAFSSGVIAACISLPSDNIKTKIQRMKADSTGKLPYSGFFDCVTKSIQREGVLGLWIGLPTFIIRVFPHAIITLLIQDLFHLLSKKYGI